MPPITIAPWKPCYANGWQTRALPLWARWDWTTTMTFSPRDVQREVFRRQVALAHEVGLPLVLHMREAHDDGFAILQEEGFPQAGVLLHCFNLDSGEVRRWVEAGCYIAFGGPLTFKGADDVRKAAGEVPWNRLLTRRLMPLIWPLSPCAGLPAVRPTPSSAAETLCRVEGLTTHFATRRGFFESCVR